MNPEKTLSKKTNSKPIKDEKKKNKTKVKKDKVSEKKPIVEKVKELKSEDTELIVETNKLEKTSDSETLVTDTNTLNTLEETTTLQDDDKKDPIVDIFNNLLTRVESIERDSRNSKNELKKVLKLYQKKSFKSKRKYDPNRTPSGFAKPSLISEELCKFLNKPSGTKMARTDVTKEVNNYIKLHKLQNPENKKKITPDETLQKLLKVTDDDSLTYFSMQKYLKDHFPKDTSTTS